MSMSEQNRGGGRVLAALVLVSLGLIAADVNGGPDGPVSVARSGVGTVVGPVESAASGFARPIRGLGEAFQSNEHLRRDVAQLQAQNSDLRNRLATSGVDRNRLAEYDGLVQASQHTGNSLVPARVIAMGPAQSFSRAVTIDAGTSSGVRPDSTVINNDGLVGRVISATRSTATVLLICDTDSVVGARAASSMKIGFVRGRGDLTSSGRLSLSLVDTSVTPSRGDNVVSWGSSHGGPYVAGVPIGRITDVYVTPRDQSKHAVVKPFVDFSSLDVVGVVVPKSTHGDRVIVRPDGSVR